MPTNHSFKTQRLFIRPVTLEDAPFILKLMNTPKWIQFIGDRNVKTIPEAEQYIKEKAFPQLENFGYTNNIVIRKTDDEKLGTCGIYHREGHTIPDVGFAFLPEFEGKGYAFEASNKLIEIAFSIYKLKKLSAYTLEDNLSSRKLLERLGFEHLGTGKLPTTDEELLHYQKLSENLN